VDDHHVVTLLLFPDKTSIDCS